MTGTVYWNELNTHDAERARAFYARVLGWTFEAVPRGAATYWLARAAGGGPDAPPVAGIYTMADASFRGIPDHWMTYVRTDALEETVERLCEGGGRLTRPPFSVPGVGVLAIVFDPGGAYFGLCQPEA